MCYDAWLQEQVLDHVVPLPPADAMPVPTPSRGSGRADPRRDLLVAASGR